MPPHAIRASPQLAPLSGSVICDPRSGEINANPLAGAHHSTVSAPPLTPPNTQHRPPPPPATHPHQPPICDIVADICVVL